MLDLGKLTRAERSVRMQDKRMSLVRERMRRWEANNKQEEHTLDSPLSKMPLAILKEAISRIL